MSSAVVSDVEARPAPLALLGRMVIYLLIAAGTAAAVHGLTIGWGLVLMAGDRAATAIVVWVGYLDLAGAASLVTSVATAAFFLVWLYRAVGRASDLGIGRPPTSPAMAVVWWFVPIAFLFMPYRVLADLNRRYASDAPGGTPSVGIWWAAWLGGIGLGRVAGLMPVNSVDDAVAWLIVSLLSSIALVVAAVYAVRIIRSISHGQAALRSAYPTPDPAVAQAPQADMIVSASQAPAEWKVCPDCAEQVREGARVCRFCRHEFVTG